MHGSEGRKADEMEERMKTKERGRERNREGEVVAGWEFEVGRAGFLETLQRKQSYRIDMRSVGVFLAATEDLCNNWKPLNTLLIHLYESFRAVKSLLFFSIKIIAYKPSVIHISLMYFCFVTSV